MAFFSLLQPEAATAGDYEAERCHVNIWSLPGWLGHRPMLFDVGVMFSTEDRVDNIEMALPVRTTARIRDLVGTMRNAEVGTLLFGRSFAGNPSDQQISLKVKRNGQEETKTYELVGVDEKKSNFPYKDAHLVAVKLALSRPVTKGQLAYIRVRFVVDHPGDMWRWQRVLGRRNGALIDFRVPDPREERQHDRSAIERRAKAVGELDAFFILPDRFRLQAANPELTYTRTLEGESWRPYLRRSVNGFSRYFPTHQRLMVHRWHPEKDGKPRTVDRGRPFRGFLQFDRAPAFRAPTDLLLTVLLTSGLFYLLFQPLRMRSGLGDTLDWFGDRIADVVDMGVTLLLAATGLTVVALGYNLIAKWKRLPRLLKQLKRLYKRAEFLWFSIWK